MQIVLLTLLICIHGVIMSVERHDPCICNIRVNYGKGEVVP